MTRNNERERQMTNAEKKQLLQQFPETPRWVLERDWSLAEAIDTMQLRREAFPATTPSSKG